MKKTYVAKFYLFVKMIGKIRAYYFTQRNLYETVFPQEIIQKNTGNATQFNFS